MHKRLKYNLGYRCTVMVLMTLKFIAKIYMFHFKHRIWDDETFDKWNLLITKLAQEYREKAILLGGVLIKVGQFLSTRTDFMPDAFIKELSGLVDRVPAMPYSYAKEIMEEEWGAAIETHIEEIQTPSIASASIGEVYRAKLKGSDTEVAIKVQRYRIKEVFHKDFKALRIVFWLISTLTSFGKKTDLPSLYRELVTVMNRELHFNLELANAHYFKEKFKGNTSLHIPFYVDELCTKRVLVMEWVEGAKVTDIEYMQRHQIDTKHVASVLFDFYLEQFLTTGKFHADPHAGNILVQPDGRIVIIDFGMVGEVRQQDSQHFKQLIQSIVMDNYDRVIETLDEMGFILPNADHNKLKRAIQETIEMYQSGTIDIQDAHIMEQIKKDIRLVIHDQPIQLSAEYAYLGRAISIIIGILIAIYPEINFQKWAEPAVKEWLGGKKVAETLYKQYAKDTIKPILSYPQAVLEWLESGTKNRQWDKRKHQRRLKHQYFIWIEVLIVMFLLLSLGGSIGAFYLQYQLTAIITLCSTAVLTILLLTILRKHYKMIQSSK
ncbi:ABC transporter [Virgibacillus dokdonensis]|uniref:Predicted unusual protein kinase regulating ubiquinone biosynthesis, AarF/ABC1/UbiB family n=2 Tax=Virgibacillus TaxID=84406 RepID=A0A1M5U5E9_9BACI|nr:MULTISPECIES: AarF/UbiB family protein [Virgibacillus]RFA36767.1 ABC transporter [Virgibacillus dokdonensis]SHH57923.1 Predicted unusual protein kinase regulating ubiquinone biosynthesis, AarF/ABC1/UbiB family [Virgibacillus chiguensis]